MGQTICFLIILTLTRLCIARKELVRQKRQILADQPRIITENGHLIFQSGINHNITFKSGTGGVFVDNLDLKNAVNQVKPNKEAIARLQDSLVSVNVTSRVASLEHRLTDYTDHVDGFKELSTTVTRDRKQVEETIQTMDNRLTHLETQTRNISDIPIQLASLNERVKNLEILVHTLENASTRMQTLLTTNECLSNPCLNGGTCEDMYNDFKCRCPQNWQGTHCTEDVNECALYTGTDLGCQNGATCHNSHGSFSCQCTANWYGIHCSEQHNDCTGASHTELCGHGTCVNEDRIVSGQAKYRCICETGWKKSSSGPECTVDVDECETGTHCSVNPPVHCNNIDGSFFCGPCPAGYTGNGQACYDINECGINNGGCSTSPLVHCQNTIGSRTCGPCPAGYQGNGVSCMYVGLCSQNNGGCSVLATCFETGGYGVTCTCIHGYFGSGVGPNGCQEQSHAGGCASSPCSNGAECTPLGSMIFSCTCQPGFSGTTCSTVDNACLSQPCQNGGTCHSHGPGYSCECTDDFTGTDCEEEQQGCGGHFYQENGSFRYPRTTGVSYPHGVSCEWLISTSYDKVLTVTFPVFNLEYSHPCDYDFLQIHDGHYQSSHMIGRYCGTDPPNGGSLNSTHNELYLWFKSDESVAHEGFEVHWTSHTPICGGYYNDSTHGSIKSPGYPGHYPHNRDCTWTIVVSRDSYIMFTFAQLALEYHDNCSYDYLEIRDGESYNAPLIKRFCSSETPDPVQTTGPYANIQFHSDETGNDVGFQIIYTAHTDGRQGCGFVQSGNEGEVISPGYPNPYRHNRQCVWVISVARGSTVQLSFTDLDLETSESCSHDYLIVRDGSDQMAPSLGRFCGKDLPADGFSTSNVIGLELHTDEQNSGRGFKAHWSTVCGGRFSDQNRQIESPNWPQYYSGPKTCNYLFEAPESHTVRFELTDNGLGDGLDCTHNYIEFHDGTTTEAATLIGDRLCDDDSPLRVMSTGNNLIVRFSTDGSVNNRGFRGTFTVVPIGSEGCGKVYNNHSGIITSPGHPNEYPNGVNCTWYINVPPGKLIRLIFLSFSFEESGQGNTCLNDFVDIYDNSTMFERSRLGRYCGSELPQMVTSSDNVLVLYMQTDAFLAREGFVASFVAVNASVCGSHLTSPSEVITSPKYPNANPHDNVCVWTITVANGHEISVNFTDLDFSPHAWCHNEFLEIRNGGSESAPLMKTYCYENEAAPTLPYLQSDSHKLYLKFKSTYLTSGRGFRLEYSSALRECGGDETGSTGSITSPNYPEPYSHRASCYWTVTVSQGSSVTLYFVDFDVGYHWFCEYFANLEIREDGPSGKSLGTFCGNHIPAPVTSMSNKLWLKLETSGWTTIKGFRLQYQTNCNRNLTGIRGVIESPNFPNPYHDHANCIWVIEVPLGNKINVSFAAFRLEGYHYYYDYEEDYEEPYWESYCYDHLEIRDGGDSNARELVKLCGYNIPDPLQSTGNKLWLNFISDFIVPEDGFRLEWVVDGCVGHLFDSTGTITSPNYPHSPTQPILECHWTITVETGKSIELTISTFDLQVMSPDCNKVFLKIFAGSDSTGPLLTEQCHKLTQPAILHTTGTTAFIQFRYVNNVVGSGFNLTYRAVSGGCGGNFTAKTATITSFSYPQNYVKNTECEWNITVASGHVVSLTFSDFHLGYYSCANTFVKLYDGPSTNARLIENLCGTVEAGTGYNSSGNHMFIRMQTSEADHQGFRATYITGCGGTLNADIDGAIFSPGYPAQSPPNTRCVWTISSSFHDRRVSLTFTHMDLESADGCHSEFVSVNEGLEPPPNVTEAQQNHFCGSSVPQMIVSEGSALSVIFQSGIYSFGSGFRAVYSSAFAACGADFTGIDARFTSPNFPDGYPSNKECEWNIKPSPGNWIQISFQTFELDPLGGINDDYVEIRSPNVSGTLVGRWFGNNSPSNLTQLSGAWVKFRSNEGGTAPGFFAEYSTSFGGTLNTDSGEIASPLYPHFFPANGNYRWTIIVSDGKRVRVTFIHLSMEEGYYYPCQFDYVQIFDGTEEDGVSLGKFCGSTLPAPLYSETNQITVKFIADPVYHDSGFLLKWDAVTNTEVPGSSVAPTTPGCSGQLVATDTPQNITSPGYPDGYPNDLDCFWTISVPEGNSVVVNITSIYLEPEDDCLTDYLRFYDGDTTDATVINTYCHLVQDILVIQSRANILSIVFHTNSDTSGPGFVFTYEIGCGGLMQLATGVISSTGYPSNHPVNQNCSWEVQVLPGKTISVEFTDPFNIADTGECAHNYLLLLNGFSSQSPPLYVSGSTQTNGRYCGSSKPPKMETSSNFLFANFVSDESHQQTGFSLKYSTVSLACGNDELRLTETVTSGYFRSPNYPQNYPHNVDCDWRIIAPASKRIQVDFEGNFSIEANTLCSLDYIAFYDGGTTHAQRIGRPFCGTSLPATVFSTGNVILARFRTDSNGTHEGFQAKYSIAFCGGRITAASGTITSPNYPERYGNNLDCKWTIAGPVGHFVHISITNFHIQSSPNCTADFLEIQDGTAADKIIFKECGVQMPQTLDTSDSGAFVRFRSDRSDTDYGFRLVFQISVEACGGPFNTPTGVFTSPNYPNQYPHTRSCTWDITVSVDRRVTLTFSDLRLEPSPNGCNSDYVEVFNGYLLDSPSLGRFCGETTPSHAIESSGNTMRVKFYTDGSGSNVGFKALYSSDREAECGGDITEFPGNITSPGFDNHTYDTNVQCVWRFNNHIANSTIRLRFSEMNLQYHSSCAHDFVEIREGEDINAPLVGKYCEDYGFYGYILIPGNHAWVQFRTDESVSYGGFMMMYDVNQCGGILTDPSGIITSPNYPSNFSERAFGCSWLISGPEGSRIKVNVTDFYKISGETKLIIFNGGLPDSPVAAAVDVSLSHLLQSNEMRVVMQTSYYHTSVRFRIEYSSESKGCGGLYHKNQGSFSSPKYPSSYPHNTECRWDINVQNGYIVTLHFNPPFDLEAQNCSKDFVEVFDVLYKDTLVSLGRWCQNVEPSDLRSSSNRMVIVFMSDATTNGNGFSATWDVACGGVLRQDHGGIISPGFPNLYANNLSCDYVISYESGTIIELDFDEFELEGGNGCQHDYLSIWDGNVTSQVTVSLGSSKNHTHRGTFCGSSIPHFLIGVTEMTVQFRTDGSGQFKGFLLHYYSYECNNVYSSPEGYIHSPDLSHKSMTMKCSWNITVSPGRIIRLRFYRFDVEASPQCQNNNLTVYDGADTHSRRIGSFCGNLQNIPNVITSTGNQMYITLTLNHGTSRLIYAAYKASYGPDQGCGGVLRKSNGTITSFDADGDGRYEDSLDCEWLIYVDENKKVALNITDMDLQSQIYSYCPDSLKIFDGSTTDDTQLTKLCGNSVPKYTIKTSSNVALVVFSTDWRGSGGGFNVTFGEIDVECGGGAYIATSTPQTLSSPNYPNTTRQTAHCVWIIDSGDDSKHVRLHVTDLQLLETAGCESEHLSFIDQPMAYYGEKEVYCGHVIPHYFDSIGSRVKITYALEANSEGQGFQLTYQIADCNQNISLPSGHITSPRQRNYYLESFSCTIHITSPENTTLALYFYLFSIENSPSCEKDFLEIQDSSSTAVARLCGFALPSPIFMTDNVATLRFKKDAVRSGHGYDITFISSTQGSGCGGNITGLLAGTFTSPGYPSSLSYPMTCTWYVTPLAGQALYWYLTFMPGTGDNCDNNYVSVYDGFRDTDPLIGRYCPSDQVSSHDSNNRIMVRYVSTGNGSAPSFRFEFDKHSYVYDFFFF